MESKFWVFVVEVYKFCVDFLFFGGQCFWLPNLHFASFMTVIGTHEAVAIGACQYGKLAYDFLHFCFHGVIS